MRLKALAFALAAATAALAGCASDGGDPDGTAGPGANGDGTDTGRFAGIPLLYLRHSETRDWLSSDSGPAGTLTMSSTATAATPREVTFTLDPPLAADVATGGTATVHIEMDLITSVQGPAPAYRVTLTVGEASAEQSQVSSISDSVLAVPASIPAGTPVRLTVCACAAASDLQVMQLHHGMRSTVAFAPPGGSDTGGEPAPTGLTSGPVQVRRDGNDYVAEQEHTAGFPEVGEAADGTLRTFNGNVEAEHGDAGLRALLWGRGSTEQQARDRLATLRVELDVSGSRYRFEVVNLDESSEGRGGSIVASVPEGQAHAELALASSNGNLGVAGLEVAILSTETSNGGIDASGRIGSWSAGTSNGNIGGEVEVEASGAFQLDTSNGGISLELARGDAAIDAEGETSNGQVELELAGTSAVGAQEPQHKHVRSDGYDSAAVQVDVVATSSNGNVSVRDA